MTRIDRARLIVSRVEFLAKEQGHWRQGDGLNFPRLHVEGQGWTASTYSPLADAIAMIRSSGYEVMIGIGEGARVPVVMDIWVDGAKVLSVEYDGDKFALRSMRPGDWEAWFLAAPIVGHC